MRNAVILPSTISILTRQPPLKWIDIVHISRRKPMTLLNSIKSPINHHRNLPENFQVENFASKREGELNPANTSLGG
jgi:hypothetical protein